jgi:hypothetical protein
LYQVDEELPELPANPLWEAKVDWSRQGVAEIKVKTSRRFWKKYRANPDPL